MLFLDCRSWSVGGWLRDELVVREFDFAGNAGPDGEGVETSTSRFVDEIGGRDVLLVTHGFNVDRTDGLNSLTGWADACRLPPSYVKLGILWPGDALLLRVIDYVVEGHEALGAGQLVADFLNQNGAGARSFTLASHSLGARVVLECARSLSGRPPVKRAIIMAGAIENDCLTREYADVTSGGKVPELVVLASLDDKVLQLAFPIGNLIGEIVMNGEIYDRSALGRGGPTPPAAPGSVVSTWRLPPFDQDPPFQGAPADWGFNHGDYLPNGVLVATPSVAPPIAAKPTNADTPPCTGQDWKPAYAAGIAATEVLAG